jgi:predicted ferric reductase
MIVSFAAALFSLPVFVWSTPLAWSANASVGLWFLLGCSVLTVLHGVVSRYLREAPAIRELTARHLAIVCGHERTCAQFLDLLRAQHDAEIRLIGVFHDTAERRGPAGAKLG